MIAILLTLSLISLTSAHPFYYEVSLNYNEGVIEITDVRVIFSDDKIETSMIGSSFIEVLDNDGKSLSKNYFEIPNTIFIEGVNEDTGLIESGEIIELSDVSFEIYLPYQEKGDEIILYDNSNEVGKIDLDDFSKIEIEKSSVNKEEKQEDQKTKSNLWILIAILIFILVLILIIYLIKTKPLKTR